MYEMWCKVWDLHSSNVNDDEDADEDDKDYDIDHEDDTNNFGHQRHVCR